MSGFHYDTVSERPPTSGRSWLLAILLVGAMAIGFAILMKQSMVSTDLLSPRIGKPFPQIEVDGWLNGPEPKPDELAGKVLVVDAWAYWCMPCRMAAPGLIELHNDFRDRDVVFLGLTSEGVESLELSKEFLADTRITWPNGYGAGRPLETLEASTIPRVWVVGRNGRIVAEIKGFDPTHEAIRSGIERALAEQP